MDRPNNKKILPIILLLLVLSSLGVLLWNIFKQNEKLDAIKIENFNLKDEKRLLENKLDSMISEYRNIEVANDSLLVLYRNEIEELENLKKKLRNSNWSIHKIKKEAEIMRSALKGYITQIDSLSRVNNQLNKKNQRISKKLVSSSSKNKALKKRNNALIKKLRIAAIIQIKSLTVNGFKMRGNIIKRTKKAKKIKKIRVNITTVANKIAEKGIKTIYIRIIGPDGKIIRSKKNRNMQAVFNNARGFYSGKKTFEFTGEEKEIIIDWDIREQKLESGEYTVEVYESGKDIGRSKITFK